MSSKLTDAILEMKRHSEETFNQRLEAMEKLLQVSQQTWIEGIQLPQPNRTDGFAFGGRVKSLVREKSDIDEGNYSTIVKKETDLVEPSIQSIYTSTRAGTEINFASQQDLPEEEAPSGIEVNPEENSESIDLPSISIKDNFLTIPNKIFLNSQGKEISMVPRNQELSPLIAHLMRHRNREIGQLQRPNRLLQNLEPLRQTGQMEKTVFMNVA